MIIQINLDDIPNGHHLCQPGSGTPLHYCYFRPCAMILIKLRLNKLSKTGHWAHKTIFYLLHLFSSRQWREQKKAETKRSSKQLSGLCIISLSGCRPQQWSSSPLCVQTITLKSTIVFPSTEGVDIIWCWLCSHRANYWRVNKGNIYCFNVSSCFKNTFVMFSLF